MNRNRMYLAGVAGLVLTQVAGAALGLSPEDKCESAKNQLAGKYAFCRLKAEAKAIKKGTAPDYSKCDTALQVKWAKAEQKAIDKGAPCIDSVTAAEVESFLSSQADVVVSALDGNAPSGRLPASGDVTAFGAGSDGAVQAGRALAYVDNGDGTVSDLNTGLMWEKKSNALGLHHKDNSYTWSIATDALDGTVVTEFLDVLNDVAGGGASCFAGHCDWRLPNVKEMHSIADHGASNPSVDPVFNASGCAGGCADVTLPTCSCTNTLSTHWSSTTTALGSASVMGVQGMLIFPLSKTDSFVARAVRGGL